MKKINKTTFALIIIIAVLAVLISIQGARYAGVGSGNNSNSQYNCCYFHSSPPQEHPPEDEPPPEDHPISRP
jgi:hypothetical protein